MGHTRIFSRPSRQILRGGVILCLSAALLAACGNRRDNAIPFDGQFFRAVAKKIDRTRDAFTVTVRPVSASFEGALQAGEYEATKYCILTFGSSDIDWEIGPDLDPEAYTIDGDQLLLSGTCTP